jgi:hypothetical protein
MLPRHRIAQVVTEKPLVKRLQVWQGACNLLPMLQAACLLAQARVVHSVIKDAVIASRQEREGEPAAKKHRNDMSACQCRCVA